MLTALAALFILQQPLLSAASQRDLKAWGEAGRRFSGPCELLAGLQAKMFVQSGILSVLGVKKKKKELISNSL